MKNFVIVADKFLFGHAAAFYCLVPPLPTVVLISKKYKDDLPLLKHELWHRQQYKKQPFTFAFKMLTDSKFRYEHEVECYAKQLLAQNHKLSRDELLNKAQRYAGFIATRYRLDVAQPEAYNDLMIRFRKPFIFADKKKFSLKNIAALVFVAGIVWVTL